MKNRLLRLAREHDHADNRVEISPVPTHADIASRVSTHREAVTRELNGLVQSGLLEKKKRTLTVTNMLQLMKMVEEVGS